MYYCERNWYVSASIALYTLLTEKHYLSEFCNKVSVFPFYFKLLLILRS